MPLARHWSRFLVVIAAAGLAGPARAADPPPVELEVDLTDVARRVVHTKLSVPANPGPLTLYYPKWIPGTHSPVGPVADQAGLRVTAGSAVLPWTRDDADPYAVRVTVPAGATTVEVAFDLLLQPPGSGGFLGTTLTAASPRLTVLNWNEVLVYPKGDGAMARPYRAAVRLPAGWKFGTALTGESTGSDRATFAAVPLEQLIDSPLICGQYVKEVPIGPAGGPRHRVVMACDGEAGLEVPAETKAAGDRLVVEAGKLFASRHYKAYTFLLALSDQVPAFGLEHHQCSDNRLPELALVTASQRSLAATLFPHEYTHSWNGKYRRPADMITADYQQPHRTRLLWVYEGLTNYLGWVLAARCGLWTPEEARDALALTADRMASSRGRKWRPLEDTASASYLLYGSPGAWSSWRRSVDFYDEGTLIWLEADVLIRQKTKGAKSLDDFCRSFYGGEGGRPRVSGYKLDDLVAALNAVAPHDWKGHLMRRVGVPTESPPLDGITEGGWKLVYRDKPSTMFEAGEAAAKGLNLMPSVGMLVGSDGKVLDVVPDGPAAKAGLAPGMRLV